LVAAEPGEAIWEGDDDRWHALFPDQPVEPLRHVFAEADPIRMGQATTREADQIHKQGQFLSVMPSRDVHIHGAHRRIIKHIIFQRLTLDHDSADGTQRPEEPTHAPLPLASVDIISERRCRRGSEKKDDVKNSSAVLLATKPVPLARLAMRRSRARVPHRFFHSVEAAGLDSITQGRFKPSIMFPATIIGGVNQLADWRMAQKHDLLRRRCSSRPDQRQIRRLIPPRFNARLKAAIDLPLVVAPRQEFYDWEPPRLPGS
jgi:hypothetical protein